MKAATIDELVDEGILLRKKNGRPSMSKEYRKLVSEISYHDRRNGGISWC